MCDFEAWSCVIAFWTAMGIELVQDEPLVFVGAAAALLLWFGLRSRRRGRDRH